MAAVQTKVAISIEMQHTGSSPCLELYELAKQISNSSKVLSVSVVLGFPYADVHEMGTSFLVITDNDPIEAGKLANKLKAYLEEHHFLFSGGEIDLKALPAKIKHAEKPLLLLDMGDNVGGGSPGDGTYLLSILENNNVGKGFVCINDPGSVEEFESLATGESLTLEVGGKTDQHHGEPVLVTAKLMALLDGKFLEKEPRHGGQVSFNMGKTAIVETIKGNTLMLTSLRIAPFSLQQLLAFGLAPQDFDVIVAKGVHAPLAAYMSVCKDLIRVNTPGVTRADIRALQYMNRRKPLYPFEPID
jgi:microcystin degradation protein MlrC